MELADATIPKKNTEEKYRKPNENDGASVWKLVKETGVLDLNSSYSYMMWCDYFKDTSIIIEKNNRIVGFISGFIKPASPERLFIWQVAVAESERGRGLASKMLHHLLKRDSCEDVQYVETTVSPSNIASQKLFKGLARDLQTELQVAPYFAATDFPEEGHEDELIHKIGPF